MTMTGVFVMPSDPCQSEFIEYLLGTLELAKQKKDGHQQEPW